MFCPLSPIYYPTFKSAAFVAFNVRPFCNPLYNWLAFGKLPENPIITPTDSRQFVQASAPNRYLESVTIEAATTTAP